MRRFVILFDEKEGTSALVRLLDHVEQVAVVHQDGGGWEPFDRHNCGAITLRDLERCLDAVFGVAPVNLATLNTIYQRSAPRALAYDTSAPVTGFKMRFQAPRPPLPGWRAALRLAPLEATLAARDQSRFERMMTACFARHGVCIFMTVRRDVLRWALSKYHGDGSGRPGHLQFKLAAGEISRQALAPFHVDLGRLGSIIAECRTSHATKRRLLARFTALGLPVHTVFYEDFLLDNLAYLQRFFALLGVPITDSALTQAIAKGAYFEKVHPTDIAQFVLNHGEVIERYAEEEAAW